MKFIAESHLSCKFEVTTNQFTMTNLSISPEIWVDINGYEGLYKISNLGSIKSLSRRLDFGKSYRITKENIMQLKCERYYFINLAKNNKYQTFRIHRLLAIHFIPNPNKYPIVNHKDGNKLNNSLSNLEWCNNSHNIKHAYSLKLNKGSIGRFGELSVLSKIFLNNLTGVYYFGYKDLMKLLDMPKSMIVRLMQISKLPYLVET